MSMFLPVRFNMTGSHIQSCGDAQSNMPISFWYRRIAAMYSLGRIVHSPCSDSSVNPPLSNDQFVVAGRKFLYLRRVTSGYEDLVKAGVRLKCQRYSLLRACGKSGNRKADSKLQSRGEQFVLECLDRQIMAYEEEKDHYEKEFNRLARKYPEIRHQKGLPGIGTKNAVKVVARIVSPDRFPDKGHFLSYSGLIKLDKVSGGRSYGKKKPRYSRQLKNVYKTGVIAAIGGNNPINDYYEHLIQEKGYSEHNARQKACRHLATLSLGVFKSGKKYKPFRRNNVESGKERKAGL